MNNKFLKYLVVVVIIFSNHSFGKEFNDLFTIYEPIQESSQIEKSINSAFNNMVYRLSGSSSPSNVWKIINSGVKRKDFIISYSIKKIDEKSYLQVIFNQDMFINKLDALSIPIINYSRPVLLFLIEIDSGSKEPYYLSFKKELDDIDKIFIDSLRENASNRGLFLELPVFDLQDAKKLVSSSILSDPTNEISSKYDFDKLIKIKLTKSGVNDWFFSGDIESNLSYPQNTIQKISDIFDEFLLKIIDETLEELDINSQKKFILNISVNNIKTHEDYIDARDRLNKIIGISSVDIMSFQNNNIAYKASIQGNLISLMRELEDNSYFKIIDYNKGKNFIALEHLK
jgi:hypothetical protein